MNKWLNFGGDRDHNLDTGIVFHIRHYWEIWKVVSTDCAARRCSAWHAASRHRHINYDVIMSLALGRGMTVPVLLVLTASLTMIKIFSRYEALIKNNNIQIPIVPYGCNFWGSDSHSQLSSQPAAKPTRLVNNWCEYKQGHTTSLSSYCTACSPPLLPFLSLNFSGSESAILHTSPAYVAYLYLVLWACRQAPLVTPVRSSQHAGSWLIPAMAPSIVSPAQRFTQDLYGGDMQQQQKQQQHRWMQLLHTWKTTWWGNVCLTQRTMYSVSDSVSSTGLCDDLNSGPRFASRGTAASCSVTFTV